jgi:hypothetical protein
MIDKLNEMWTALAAYQDKADAAGHGESWAMMCSERTERAANIAGDEVDVVYADTTYSANAALAAWSAAYVAAWAATKAATKAAYAAAYAATNAATNAAWAAANADWAAAYVANSSNCAIDYITQAQKETT